MREEAASKDPKVHTTPGFTFDGAFYDMVYKNVKELSSDEVDVRKFMSKFAKMGILDYDPRVKEIFQKLEVMPAKITKDMLFQAIEGNELIVDKVLQEDFIIPEF